MIRFKKDPEATVAPEEKKSPAPPVSESIADTRPAPRKKSGSESSQRRKRRADEDERLL